jgi:hypothetical protein
MAYAPTQLRQDPQYESFLSAPVGEDRRGSSVTVLSMLARLGIDPWGEASDLAKLPEAAARQRLEALMARFNDVSTLVSDRNRIVSGLLAFLPSQATSARLSPEGVSTTSAFLPKGSWFYWIVATALLLGWVAMIARGH